MSINGDFIHVCYKHLAEVGVEIIVCDQVVEEGFSPYRDNICVIVKPLNERYVS